MSRLWRDQLHVFLAPGRMDWVRLKRSFKSMPLAKATVFFNPGESEPNWSEVLRQLNSVLANAAGAELSVVVSNHWVRYVALPPQREITTPDEVKSYAGFRLREVYGDRVDAWQLSISDWNPLDGAVCAAISRDLMMQLEQLVSACRCKIKVIEPYLASVHDRWQAQLKGEKVFLAVVESGRICLAVIHHGRWQSIRNQRISGNIGDDLLAALDQEAIGCGVKEALAFVHLFAPEHPDLTLPHDSGWSAIALSDGKLPPLAHYPAVSVKQTGFDQCPA